MLNLTSLSADLPLYARSHHNADKSARSIVWFTLLVTIAWLQIAIPLACAQGTNLAKKTKTSASPGWKPLFDGKSLHGWEVTKFGGEGDVEVKDGVIYLGFGSPMTGITYKEPSPKCNYELRLEAKRIDGVDFFCALTFPVNESHCSFVVGGWGGAVVGISSIDGHDASENETTSYIGFKTGRWYRIRVRVQADRIAAWIDDKQVVDVSIRGKKLTTRPEVDLSIPLGIANFETRAGIRNIQIRPITAVRTTPTKKKP